MADEYPISRPNAKQYLPTDAVFDATGEYYVTLHARREGAQGIFTYRRFGPFTHKPERTDLFITLHLMGWEARGGTQEWDREEPKD